MARTYATPASFKEALEAQIRRRALSTHRDLGRLRQRHVFDRFLARLSAHFGDRVVLKGGVVLELRLGRARTTKDIDLSVSGDPGRLALDLGRAGEMFSVDGDFLRFTVALDTRHPTIDVEGLAYQGQRFRVTARLAGKIYGGPFGVDVVFGDPRRADPAPRAPEFARQGSA